MEFTKDITFGGDLKANKTAKITYSGDLYKKGSDFVAIVYGFGQNWDYTTEQPMDKIEGGFTTEIGMKEGFDTFNFCFRNGGYEWDNNQTLNYISAIGPADTVAEETVEIKQEEDFGFDTDKIIEILDNLLEDNITKATPVEEASEKQQILDDILSETETPVDAPVLAQEFDMDELIESILNPVVNYSVIEEETQEVAGGILEVEKPANIEVTAEDLLSTVFTETEEGIVSGEAGETGLVPTEEAGFLVSPRKLRKFYMIRKKIKLALYKLVVTIPKLLAGTLNENND